MPVSVTTIFVSVLPKNSYTDSNNYDHDCIRASFNEESISAISYRTRCVPSKR
jgi:hypothetical protein